MSYGIKDAIRDAAHGQLKISETDQSKVRYDICKACDHFKATLTCGLCGCFMPAKTKLASASCPDNPPRW